MSSPSNFSTFAIASINKAAALIAISIIAYVAALAVTQAAAQSVEAPDQAPRPAANQPGDRGELNSTDEPSPRQAELEAAFVKMLTGATLEGSFTSTGAGRDPTKLSREKYTLGEVKKLAGNMWLLPARIEYGEHDVTLPITVPIHWAADTPVIVVHNLDLPGFGTVSARVMFFADHYAGYWKHGRHGGHLFGVIRRGDEPAAEPNSDGSSVDDPPAGQERDE